MRIATHGGPGAELAHLARRAAGIAGHLRGGHGRIDQQPQRGRVRVHAIRVNAVEGDVQPEGSELLLDLFHPEALRLVVVQQRVDAGEERPHDGRPTHRNMAPDCRRGAAEQSRKALDELLQLRVAADVGVVHEMSPQVSM